MAGGVNAEENNIYTQVRLLDADKNMVEALHLEYKFSTNKYLLNRMINGTWGNPQAVITNNDFGYIVGQAKTIINTPVVVENAPNSANYVPVITSHSETNSCLENVFWIGDKWYVYSTAEQIIKIRFYKYPV